MKMTKWIQDSCFCGLETRIIHADLRKDPTGFDPSWDWTECTISPTCSSAGSLDNRQGTFIAKPSNYSN